MWHAELGRSLPDMWTGPHQRGVQLHDLRARCCSGAHRYGQRGWLRQLSGRSTRSMEDAALRTVARLDGTPFPSTARLAGRWLRGRVPQLRRAAGHAEPRPTRLAGDRLLRRGRRGHLRRDGPAARTTSRPSWYDPGRFWSGDDLDLAPGFPLGGEIEVVVPRARPRQRGAESGQRAPAAVEEAPAAVTSAQCGGRRSARAVPDVGVEPRPVPFAAITGPSSAGRASPGTPPPLPPRPRRR